MESNHHIIELDAQEAIISTPIFSRDNNVEKKHNLDEIPAKPAIYTICGRVNGKPANPRYTNICEDLRSTIADFFDKDTPYPAECFGEFMRSIKLKHLLYIPQDQRSADEMANLLKEWQNRFEPKCNETLNEVF